MYNLFWKAICMFLCLTLVLCTLPIAYATETTSDPNYFEEYITFTSGDERMKADGSFKLNVRAELRSESNFTANRSSITISTKCKKLNANSGDNVPDSGKGYTVTLYNADTHDEVGSYSGVADGKTYDESFSVVTNQDYYFRFTCDPELSMPYSLYGTGKVSNVTVLIVS